MKPFFSSIVAMLLCVVVESMAAQCGTAQIPKDYKGKPFKDAHHKQGAQVIPGRVELALYDLGGEGVAYHDTTPENEGAKLNHTQGHWRPGVPKEIIYFLAILQSTRNLKKPNWHPRYISALTNANLKSE